MVKLELEDRRQLLGLLEALPDLDTIKKRRDALRSAGLGNFISRVDLSDPQRSAVAEIVDYLAIYGRVTKEHEALGRFLSVVQTFLGREQQELIAGLITKYNMMIPAAVHPLVKRWRSDASEQDISEKIIGENTLRPIAFLTQGDRVARSVAFLRLATGSGTGFLISPDLLVTNHHILPAHQLLTEVIFRFDYEETWSGEMQPVREYRAKAGGVFHCDESLDYSIVELEGRPGDVSGWLELAPRDVRVDERVNIVQHAGGLPKQVSLQNNFVQYVDENVIQYVTSTLPGSSGSPVLNDVWKVVALHHAGGDLSEPRTGRRYFRNEGIRVGPILKSIPEQIRERLAKKT